MDLSTAPIGLLIKKINERMKQTADRQIAQDGITREQGHLLMTLYHHGGQTDMTMKMLQERIRVAQSSLVGIVSRLQKKAMVQTYRDDRDKRVKHVRLTESGRAHCTQVIRKLSATEQRLLSGLTEAEEAELRRLLSVLYTTLKKDPDETSGQKGTITC